MNSLKRRLARLGIGLGLAATLALNAVVPALADDVTGSATVTGGTLSMAATDPPVVSVTLNGTNQTPSDTINIDVRDLRGSGVGWNLTVTSTTFTTAGGKTLSTSATTITGVAVTCDQGTCTSPTNAISYPLTLPAGATAPTAAKFYNSAADTGMGDFTITPTVQVAIPANAYAGSYSSTITISAVSGP